ncbi:MAG: hypothetical protein V5A43_00890 [Haloarculaceae archaeon]
MDGALAVGRGEAVDGEKSEDSGSEAPVGEGGSSKTGEGPVGRVSGG